MNLKAEKEKLIDWLQNLDDETTIARIKLLKDSLPENGWWEELSEAEKASIERGLADVEAGRIISHADVMKRYEKWL